jgi:hypothetical protein
MIKTQGLTHIHLVVRDLCQTVVVETSSVILALSLDKP